MPGDRHERPGNSRSLLRGRVGGWIQSTRHGSLRYPGLHCRYERCAGTAARVSLAGTDLRENSGKKSQFRAASWRWKVWLMRFWVMSVLASPAEMKCGYAAEVRRRRACATPRSMPYDVWTSTAKGRTEANNTKYRMSCRFTARSIRSALM